MLSIARDRGGQCGIRCQALAPLSVSDTLRITLPPLNSLSCRKSHLLSTKSGTKKRRFCGLYSHIIAVSSKRRHELAASCRWLWYDRSCSPILFLEQTCEVANTCHSSDILALPTECATSFNSSGIRLESVLPDSPASRRQRYF